MAMDTSPTKAINPINIAAAALLTQVLIVVTLTLGNWLLGGRQHKRLIRLNIKDDPLRMRIISLPAIIIIATLLTIGVLLISDELVTTWRPLIGSDSFLIGLQTSTAISIMFYVDILTVSYLVLRTEGSRRSPFSPVFFILPSLAIFLRQPLTQLILYTSFVLILFTLLMFCGRLRDSEQLDASIARSYWIVSAFCFVVTTLLAIITRPV
jgi:hypothetical protein